MVSKEERKMDVEKIREQIEINKRNARKEIENEEMVAAMWSVSALIDLKAQEAVLERIEKEGEK